MPITIISAGGRRPRIVLDDYARERLNNGVEDVSPALIAALNKHKSVTLLPGTYKLSPASLTTIPAGGSIRGSGIGATILQLVAGETGIGLRGSDGASLYDLCLKGNDEANTTGFACASGGTTANLLLSRVKFQDLQFGIADNGAMHGVRVIACEFESNTIAGIRTNSASTNLAVLGCRFNGNAAGIELQGSPLGGMIAGCNFEGGTTGIGNSSGSYFTIAGNRFNAGTTQLTAGGSRNEYGVNHYVSGAYDGASLVSNTVNTHLGKFYRTSAPNAGVWLVGDIIWNRSAGALQGDPLGWQCVTAGTAGVDAVFAPFYRSEVIDGSFAWNPPSINNGAFLATTTNITGAAVGDYVSISASAGTVPDGVLLRADVTASTVIRVTIYNFSGSAQDLNLTLALRVHKK